VPVWQSTLTIQQHESQARHTPRSFVPIPTTYLPKKGGAPLTNTPDMTLVERAVKELILSIERRNGERNAA
jgi:hypothetical protein